MGDCLIAAQSEGICPDGSDYLGTLDSGGAAPDTTIPNYAQEAVDYGLTPAPPPAPTVSSLPLSLPSLLLPKGVTASPAGLQTNVVCPPGYAAVGGVCSPLTSSTPATATIISGVPNWALYGGAGILILVTMMMSSGGRRR